MDAQVIFYSYKYKKIHYSERLFKFFLDFDFLTVLRIFVTGFSRFGIISVRFEAEGIWQPRVLYVKFRSQYPVRNLRKRIH